MQTVIHDPICWLPSKNMQAATAIMVKIWQCVFLIKAGTRWSVSPVHVTQDLPVLDSNHLTWEMNRSELMEKIRPQRGRHELPLKSPFTPPLTSAVRLALLHCAFYYNTMQTHSVMHACGYLMGLSVRPLFVYSFDVMYSVASSLCVSEGDELWQVLWPPVLEKAEEKEGRE